MKRLVEVLAQKDAVLFVGSGVSMWSGLPSWPGLVEELAVCVEASGESADLVRAEAARGDLLQAASYGVDRLTPHQLGGFVRKACRTGIATPHEIHRQLVTLGPTCFITTNYDDLIEQALRTWRADRTYRGPVTNRHLTEIAEVSHARATEFVFKPHGDAADTESIILTREQYRTLLPQGERHAALETLKILLSTRPVVYVGFGLRDPDFLLLRDTLANTFRGGVRDHFAIMADVGDAERGYWRRNYGIHLVGYETNEREDGSRDHGPLLALLQALSEDLERSAATKGVDFRDASTVLALARHAAGLASVTRASPEFTIRVRSKARRGMHERPGADFDNWTADKFLSDGPHRALLLGLPGAGKSYSIRQAAARLAEKVHASCLALPFDPSSIVVPLFVDFKLYQGDLFDLLRGALPIGLPLEDLLQNCRVKVFLDSFNEMPREYRDSGSFESDLADFLSKLDDSTSVLIASRTQDGLDKTSLPAFSLESIDAEEVASELDSVGVELEGPFRWEVLSLLQRPFYFQLVQRGIVELPKNSPRPHDVLEGYLSHIRSSFTDRFHSDFDIAGALSDAAYAALDSGEEAFRLAGLLESLETHRKSSGLHAEDLANWLVSASVLMPYSGGRISFIHQSITEYLAAMELARRYRIDETVLSDKLSLLRWDQALFLTLGLLDRGTSLRFLRGVMDADFSLALNAARYLDTDEEDIVSRLLAEVIHRAGEGQGDDHFMGSAIERVLPLTSAHVPQLRELIACGHSVGAGAVKRLVNLEQDSAKDYLLPLLVAHRDDYNLCANGIGPALEGSATEEDANRIAKWADAMAERGEVLSENSGLGFLVGAARFLKKLDLTSIRRQFLPFGEPTSTRAQVLSYIARERRTADAAELAGDLLLQGVPGAEASLYFSVKRWDSDDEQRCAGLNVSHVSELVRRSDDPDRGSWALETLRRICQERPDLAARAVQEASGCSSLKKAVIKHCATPGDDAGIVRSLRDLAAAGEDSLDAEPLWLLAAIDVDWGRRESLFVELLERLDVRLARVLLGPSWPVGIQGLGEINFRRIESLLDWMTELKAGDKDSVWCFNQLASLLAGHLPKEMGARLLDMFNQPGNELRPVIGQVLACRADVSTEDLSADSLACLIEGLGQKADGSSFGGHLLGLTATEGFASEQLLPLLANANPTLSTNLRSVLEQASSRHGTRYVVDSIAPGAHEASSAVHGAEQHATEGPASKKKTSAARRRRKK